MVVAVRSIVAYGPADPMYGASVLPGPDSRGRPKWRFVDPTACIRRHALIAEVRIWGLCVYLFEIERRPTDAFRALIVADSSGACVSDASLARILEWCAEHSGLWGKTWELKGWVRRTFKHPHRSAEDADPEDYIDRYVPIMIREIERVAGGIDSASRAPSGATQHASGGRERF
jgi:hypothetical protein